MDFNVIEAIKERRSVRTFEEKPLTAELKQQISDYIATLSNPFGDDTVRIPITDRRLADSGEKLGTYGVVKDASAFIGLLCGRSETSMVAAGYEFEQLILYITSLGLGTVWLGATFSRKKFSAAFKIKKTEQLLAITPVGYPAKKRLVERLLRTVARSDTRLPWNELFFNENFSTQLTADVAGDHAEALEMVRLAPSATNTQPWRIVKNGDRYHFYIAFKEKPSDDEYIFRLIDMGIALCHFDLSLKSANIEGQFTHVDPNIPDCPIAYRYVATWSPTESPE